MHACMRACVCVYACIYACLYRCLSMCAGMNVCRYACVYVCVHRRAQRRRQGLRPSDTPAVPGRQRELCAWRRSPPVQSATRRTAGTRFSADRARSTPMRARRSARALQCAQKYRREDTLARVGVPQQSWVDPVLFEAAPATRSLLTPAKCESERAPTRKSERTEGLEDGPIGCGAPGVGSPPDAPGVSQGRP
jgi:hypothetical protein